EVAYSKIISVMNKDVSNAVVIYPNPSVDRTFKMTTTYAISQVKVYTKSGREVGVRFNQDDSNVRVEMDGSIPSGSYILTIQTNKGLLTRKIVVR
ncbi:MAG: T9SS type A sorting domain-containing protein, partial [Leadbetterella sp.]